MLTIPKPPDPLDRSFFFLDKVITQKFVESSATLGDALIACLRTKTRANEDGSAGLSVDQYSLGKWIMLLAKYSVISSSGKSVCSICSVNTILPLPSSHVSVAARSGRTASFQT